MIAPEIRKTAVIQGMVEARGAILDNVQMLTPVQWEVVYLGEWKVADMLAHLVGWDLTNIQAIQELRQSRLPEFYSYIGNDWRQYNAVLVKRHHNDDQQVMVASVRESHAQLVSSIEAVDPRDFDRDWGVRYKGYRVTIARLLEAEASDERVHARQLSDFFNLHPRIS